MEKNELNTTIEEVKYEVLDEQIERETDKAYQAQSRLVQNLKTYQEPNTIVQIKSNGYRTKPIIKFDEQMYQMFEDSLCLGLTLVEIAKELRISETKLKKLLKEDSKLRQIQLNAYNDLGRLAISVIKHSLLQKDLSAATYVLNRRNGWKNTNELTIKGDDIDRKKIFSEIKKSVEPKKKPPLK